MPRTVYAMAADGLLPRILSRVHPRTQVPLITICVFGGISACIATVIDTEVLVDLLAIGAQTVLTLHLGFEPKIKI
jgi:amino acid transporter